MSYPTNADLSLIGDFLNQIAGERWLQSEELYIILMMSGDSNRINIPVFGDPVRNPQNGCLCLMSNPQTAKKDGIEWIMKREAFRNRAQESTVELKVNGVEVIHGVYCRTVDYPKNASSEVGEPEMVNFNRRIYSLKNNIQPINVANNLLLFHYRECPKAEKFMRVTLHPVLDRFLSYLRSVNKFPVAPQTVLIQQQQQQQQMYSQQTASGYWAAPNSLVNMNQQMVYSAPAYQNVLVAQPHMQQQPVYYQTAPGIMQMNAPMMNTNMMGGMPVVMQQPPMSHVQYQQVTAPYQPMSGYATSPHQQYVHQGTSASSGAARSAVDTGAVSQVDDLELDFDKLNEFEFMDLISDLKQDGDDGISNGSTHIKLENDMPAIVDFSPGSIDLAPKEASSASSAGDIKMLICLSSEALSRITHLPLMVCFFDTLTSTIAKLPCEMVTPTVLRCYPSSVGSSLTAAGPANCRICVEDATGVQVTKVADETLEFIPQKTRSNSHLGKRQLPNKQPNVSPISGGSGSSSSGVNIVPPLVLTGLSSDSSSSGRITGSDSNRTALSFMTPFASAAPPVSSGRNYSSRAQSSRSDDSVDEHQMDRENKIRIVEKLGYMKSALLHDEQQLSTGQNSGELVRINSANSNDGVVAGGELEDDWLDDNQLSNLSHAELEALMDKYITTVVKHMVQLAALDDDLKAEIDSLDSSGFSLLHYCCLYNLNSLIPVMLAKGADINARTGAGTTALHLAAAAGHMVVVRLLIECGANVHALDDHQLLPSDAARLASQHQICNYLMELEDSSGMTDREQKISPCLSSGNTPRIAPTSLDGGSLLYPGSGQDFSNSNSLNASFASSGDVNDNDSSNLSNKLLHVAFASLSLTDKCALSLSIGQLNKDPNSATGVSSITSPRSAANSQLNTPRDVYDSQGSALQLSTSGTVDMLSRHSATAGTPQSTLANASATLGGASSGTGQLLPPHPLKRVTSIEDDISEMHSVLSESDKESLVVAMSMMGPLELSQVDDEVRRIQNNVRGWLLRKNYTNLRDAAKVLQMAWREKKRTTAGAVAGHAGGRSVSGPVPSTSSNTMNYIVQQDNNKRRTIALGGPVMVKSGVSDGICAGGAVEPEPDLRSDTPALGSRSISNEGFSNSSSNLSPDLHQRELHAAEKLQAATRRMIARKSFSSLRKQTMASLVIQKSLVKWWVNNRSNSPAPTAGSRPTSLRLSKGISGAGIDGVNTERSGGMEIDGVNP